MWEYDPLADTWSPVTQQGTVPPGRAFHATALEGEFLRIFGGEGASGPELSDSWSFDLTTTTWSRNANLLVGVGDAAASPTASILLFGGLSGGVPINRSFRFTAGAPVSNQPPAVAANNASVSTNEGTNAANTGTYSDPDGDAVTLSASAGTVVSNGDGTWSWSNPAPDGPASYNVTITADDGNGGTATATFSVTVDNVAPTSVGVSNSGPVNTGSAATITVNATDPAGANDPLSYSFDCDNDGVYEIGPQGGNSAQCTFAAPGGYTVNVLVDDGDGGTATGSTVVTVDAPLPTNKSDCMKNGAAY
ncbi:MAG: cadherin-like domain-containing protein [Deltaproteobacteria bacterium]|nr:cadherin-like domain-containing protein [Deltaproteobacteria bacterium]